MPIISLRVPDRLKEKMDEHGEINWSAVIRSNLEDEVERLEARDVGHAVALSERLSGAIDGTDVADENTADVIREWREKRYGADPDG